MHGTMMFLGERRANVGANGPEIVYVSKFSPSQSGVALYADTFLRVLSPFGRVESIQAPAEPHVAQRFRAALRGLLGAATGVPHSVRLIHVELSGRSLFEFYFALGTLVRGRRPLVVITCHDVPAIVGPPMLFAALDRRGLRRIGMMLSRLFGSRLEQWLLEGTDAVATLTEEGAMALERSAGRHVYALPHVVAPEPAPQEKEPLIFIPGPVDDVDGISAVVQTVTGLKLPDRWRVVVGVCAPHTRATVFRRLDGGQAPSVDFLGLVDESTLFRLYHRARFVVRLRAQQGANRLAASSPLMLALAAGCVCITNDDRAGARELEHLGLVIRVPEPAQTLAQLLVNPGKWRTPAELVEGIRAYSGLEATVRRYSGLLDEIGFAARDRTVSGR